MPSPAVAEPGDAWHDPSPHSATLVTVEQNVELEVLDWGGSGRPILLLAGLGDTAHVFDDFAPALTGWFHVYALTRRGFGKSSAPETGYSVNRLAEDVISVVRALGLKDPIVAGHSFAGEEMHILAHRYPSEVAGLVYIDAAFNRADDSSACEAKLRELPPGPQPRPDDLRSIATLREFNARNGLPRWPEAALRDRFVADTDGLISGQKSPPPTVREGMTAAMRALVAEYRPEPIQVPALTIYAVPAKPGDLMLPTYGQGDASLQSKVGELFALARARFQRHAEWFRSFAGPSSRVAEISGRHHLFVSNPVEVGREIEAFSSSLD